MLTHLKQKTKRVWNQSKRQLQTEMGWGKYMIFQGSEENFISNGAWMVEESILLFHGRANPIRHFSVNDLNNMNVECQSYYTGGIFGLYQGSWEGRAVMVKNFYRHHEGKENSLREIVVATQMNSHNNALKLLGCCLETEVPILVYEWVASISLADCILLKDDNQDVVVVKWEDRLRIAWEISHVVAYLHTAFPRPIIHRDLKPKHVFLDQGGAAKLGDFSLTVSIPEGEQFVEVPIVGTVGYLDPEYYASSTVAESTDVYSFGMLFLVLLTGRKAQHNNMNLDTLVRNGVKDNSIHKNIDPLIIKNGVTAIEDLQLRASIQLALLCTDAEADRRPTMVEVATQLKNLVTSPESIYIPPSSNFQDDDLPCTSRSNTDEVNMEEDNEVLFQSIGHELSNKGTTFEMGNSATTQSSIDNATSTATPNIVAQLQRHLELNNRELLKTKQALSDALQKISELQKKK